MLPSPHGWLHVRIRRREERRIMSLSYILSWPYTCIHDSRREGVELGFAMATAIWLWIAVVDAVAGRPFHTFDVLGGVLVFTVVHYLLNITYGVVLLSAVHGAERAPSLVFAMVFGGIIFEGGIAMLTNVLAEARVGQLAWIGIFGGSLLGAAVALALLMRTHPLREYLRRAEEED
jgi:hypothetical protein